MKSQGGCKGRPEVLIFIGYYRPAFRAGGPIKSIENMIAHISDEFSFSVVTSDRDIGSPHPLEGVQAGEWVVKQGARVLYVPSGKDGCPARLRLLRETPHDLLYLSSCFARESVFALFGRRFGLVRKCGVIVAPRGEFSPGALGLKSTKKATYLSLARLLRLFDGVVWHSTSELESQDLQAAIGRPRGAGQGPRIVLAPNIPTAPASAPPALVPRGKKSGEAKLVFLGRISRKKNLDYVLSLLNDVAGRVELDIIGPIEDEQYWEGCKQRIRRLPGTVVVRAIGPLPPAQIQTSLGKYHLSVLPTLGENFGHTILEALSCGCPVLISDQTPWRGMEAEKAGWDLPLRDPAGLVRVVDRVVQMGQEEFDVWSRGAARFASRFSADPALVEPSRRLLRAGLEAGGPGD